MISPAHPICWLRHAGQRLGLVPTKVKHVAARQLDRTAGSSPGTSQPQEDTMEMRPTSKAFQSSPYANQALQRFVLMDSGINQTLTVTDTDAWHLPYDLANTRLSCARRAPA